jgi:hypothetical protein
MATITTKTKTRGSISHPLADVKLRAEKVTDWPEKWFLEFRIVPPIPLLASEVVHTLEFSTAEMDELFMAYEMIKPIAKGADKLSDEPRHGWTPGE